MSFSRRLSYILKISFSLIVFFLLLSCSKEKDTSVLARIGNEEINLDDFILNYELQAKPGARPRTFSDRQKFLHRMIENQLLALYGMEKGYAQDSRIIHQLKAIEKELLIDGLYRKKVSDQVRTSEDELREGFLRSKTKVRARHLFVKSREQADSLLTLLKKGFTFQQLSQDLFRDSTLAANGGDLGYFSFGEMDEAFENAAYDLKIGEISEPVKTRWGYHIIKVEDRKVTPIITESEFQSSRHRIERIIRQRKETALANEYVKNLMKDKDVVVKADAVNFLVRAAKRIKKRTTELLPESLPELSDEEIQLVQKDVASHLKDIIVEFANGKWTIERFFQKIAESLPRNRPILTSHLDIAEKIAIMVRNEFLAKQALKEGIQNQPEVRRRMRMQKKRLIATLVRMDISESAEPTQQQIQNFYQSHLAKYSTPVKYHVFEIAVSDSVLAEKIYQEILNGADFSQLAREYSERKTSAERGGDLGIIIAPDHPQFAEKLKQLEIGEITRPFSVVGKYFILKLIQKIPAKPLSFWEIENLVYSDTKNYLIKKRIQTVCDQMRSKYPVEIFEENLNRIQDQGDNVVEMIKAIW